jgi:drug/metabolite transporter (DMT)-like permease
MYSSGYGAAAVAVLIWGSYPVVTRSGVTGAFEPADLMLLRFGIGALLFLPYLALQYRAIPRETWKRGVPLSLFQGAGMAAFVIFGLQFAPASHAAALGPGFAPIWVVLLGVLLFARRPSAGMLLGSGLSVIGVIALTAWSATMSMSSMLMGDSMFLAASALGALYVLLMRDWGINAGQGAAIVTFYSALTVIPWYIWQASGALWQVPVAELLWQVLWQGVLIGCVALIALNQAIARLGPERSISLVALVPAVSAVLGFLFLEEIPASTEILAILAISIGISICVSTGYGGNPAARRASANRAA